MGKLSHGSTLTKLLRRMNSRTRRKRSKVCALLSSRSCMLLLVVLPVVCQVVCQEVCQEACPIWVQVLVVPEVGQLSKKLIKRTFPNDELPKKNDENKQMIEINMDCP